MTNKQQAAILDFGTSKIVAAVAESGGPGDGCNILHLHAENYSGFMDGRWNDSPEKLNEALSNCVKALKDGANKPLERIFVGVPAEYLQIIVGSAEAQLKNRRVSPADIERILDDAMPADLPAGYEIINRCPAFFRVDDIRTMDPLRQRGGRLSAKCSYVLADHAFLDDVENRLLDLGVVAVEFLAAPLAVALMLITPEDRDRGAMLIDMGYLSTTVAIAEGDALAFLKSVPMGGGHIAADVAFGLEQPLSVAEEIKRKYTLAEPFVDLIEIESEDEEEPLTFDRREVGDVLEPRVEEILEWVSEAFEKSDFELLPRASCYLTGGGLANMRGGREYVSQKISRTIKAPLPRHAKWGSHTYASSMALLEMALEAALSDKSNKNGGPMASIKSFLKAFVSR